MMKFETRKLALTAMFIALGTIVPQVFHLFGMGAGATFLPMHIPVLLCGSVLGGGYGLICGLLTPFLSSLVTGMPPLFPVAFTMAIELAVYGFVIGKISQVSNIYVAYGVAMISGRVINGIVNAVILGMNGNTFSLTTYLSGTFIGALPGIILQIILIPILFKLLKKYQLFS